MATKKQFKMNVSQRRMRHFSESFKRSKVLEISQGRTKVSEICKEYEVSSTNVYRWIRKFGTLKKEIRMVVESNSDTKKILELKQRIAELERSIGQKQIQIDFQTKMIELAEEEYKVDIKKKYSSQPYSTSDKNESDTHTL